MATRKGYLSDGLGNVVIPNTELDSVMDKATGRKLSEIVPTLATKTDLHSYKGMPVLVGTTVSEIDSIYNNLHANASDDEYYKKIVHHGVAHSKLPEGSWYLEGIRKNSTHGWQRIISYAYSLPTGPITFKRSILAGVWTDWMPDALPSNMDLYVSTTGNDTTGDGTSAKPFATLDRALKSIPKDLNGFNVTIYFAPGTYAGGKFLNFKNGYIRIARSITGDLIFNSTVTITACNTVIFTESFYISPGGTDKIGLSVHKGSHAIVQQNITVDNALYGVICHEDSKCQIVGILTGSNCNIVARETDNSELFVNKIAGTGNTYGISAVNGGTVSYYDVTSLSATNKFSSGYGGQIIPHLNIGCVAPTPVDPGANANYSNYPDDTLVVVYE